MKIKLENGIPMRAFGNRGLTEALKTMKIGQSFGYSKMQRSGIYAIAKRHCISIRVLNHESDPTMVRVWRTK
jgi:hypothetical protein